MTLHATNPFRISIDKISITGNDTSGHHVHEALNRLTAVAEYNPLKVRLKAGHRHHLQANILLAGSTSPLLLQAGPRHSGISDYRIEFNPAALGYDGLGQIREVFDRITHIGFWGFVDAGKVTRIDVALDLPNLSLENVIVRSKGQRKHGVFSNSGGQLESAYQGSPKANRTVSYNREDNLGDASLRIERRLKPNCLGCDLVSLTNPFDKVDLVSTASVARHLDGLMPQQFFDSVRVRGFRSVLKTLPRKQRQAIVATLSDPSQTMLPPMDLIWERWPGCLSEELWIGALNDERPTTAEDDSDAYDPKERTFGESLRRLVLIKNP